jgi:hypothetical protein
MLSAWRGPVYRKLDLEYTLYSCIKMTKRDRDGRKYSAHDRQYEITAGKETSGKVGAQVAVS